MQVFCYASNTNSLYIPLLHRGIRDRYTPVQGADAAPAQALRAVAEGRDVAMHIHWEEFILQKCKTTEAARGATLLFQEQMRAFRRRGGRTFWTVHNILPHRIPHIESFLDLRRFLASFADGVLVHSDCAVSLLQQQVAVPAERIEVLPHPAYTGLYEPAAQTEAELGTPAGRNLLCFGAVRRQKGFGRLIDMLPADFLAQHQAQIQISGTGPEAELVRAGHPDRPDVIWDLRYVPMEEAPRLIRSAACTILPYENFLTSGVALLVMTSGGLLVAADAPQFRELLPPETQCFLYRPGDSADLQRVISAVLALTPEARETLCRANYHAARRYDPEIIGPRLATFYERRGLRASAPMHLAAE